MTAALAADRSYMPVQALFPTRSPRWCNDVCRAGKVPGARKIGGSWFLRACDVDAPSSSPSTPTIEDAEADLRRRGVL